MIDYPIITIIRKESMAMSTFSYRWERTKFVFTGRTEVRLGGFEYAYLVK